MLKIHARKDKMLNVVQVMMMSRPIAWFGPGTDGSLGLRVCPLAMGSALDDMDTTTKCFSWAGGGDWNPLADMNSHHMSGAFAVLDGGERVWVGGGHGSYRAETSSSGKK